jgi:hypothetical protein
LDGVARIRHENRREPYHREEVQEQLEERLALGGPTIGERRPIVISPRNDEPNNAVPTPGLTFVKVVGRRPLVPNGGDVLRRRIIVVIDLESLPPNACNVLRLITCSKIFLANIDLLLDDSRHRHCISPPPPSRPASGNVPDCIGMALLPNDAILPGTTQDDAGV